MRWCACVCVRVCVRVCVMCMCVCVCVCVCANCPREMAMELIFENVCQGGVEEEKKEKDLRNVTADECIEEWLWTAPNYIIDKKGAKMWGVDVSLEHLSASSRCAAGWCMVVQSGAVCCNVL